MLAPFELTAQKPQSYRAMDEVFGESRGMPIDRYYIEKFLSGRKNLKRDIKVLEVGDSNYSKKYLPNAKHFVLEY